MRVTAFKGVVRYFKDINKIFLPEFKKRSYDKHLYYSAVLTFAVMWLLFRFTDIATTGFILPIVLGGLGAYGVNFMREWYRAIEKKIEPDITDANMGSYGGVIGTVIFLIVNSIL
jgi:hypothetical protein